MEKNESCESGTQCLEIQNCEFSTLSLLSGRHSSDPSMCQFKAFHAWFEMSFISSQEFFLITEAAVTTYEMLEKKLVASLTDI